MSDAWPDYELVDFGEGRRLERFAGQLVDRPCPIAVDKPKTAPKSVWREAIARYDGGRAADGVWKPALKTDAECVVPLSNDCEVRLAVTPTPAGQVGLFPEQFLNWRWLFGRLGRLDQPRVLNLFAYTGGSTLAAAAAGAEVTHVDASKPSVALARENAARSGLSDAPIRWLVEDVVRYCQREVKRGARYDAVVLDPPTYGHGPKGEAWRLERDLPAVLALCGELVERAPKLFLLTCHTPGVGPAEASAYLADGVFGHCGQPAKSGALTLEASDGRRLKSGVFARWPRIEA